MISLAEKQQIFATLLMVEVVPLVQSDSVGLLDSLRLSTGRVVVHLVGLSDILESGNTLYSYSW